MKNIEELSKKIKLTETEKEMFELLSIHVLKIDE